VGHFIISSGSILEPGAKKSNHIENHNAQRPERAITEEARRLSVLALTHRYPPFRFIQCYQEEVLSFRIWSTAGHHWPDQNYCAGWAFLSWQIYNFCEIFISLTYYLRVFRTESLDYILMRVLSWLLTRPA